MALLHYQLSLLLVGEGICDFTQPCGEDKFRLWAGDGVRYTVLCTVTFSEDKITSQHGIPVERKQTRKRVCQIHHAGFQEITVRTFANVRRGFNNTASCQTASAHAFPPSQCLLLPLRRNQSHTTISTLNQGLLDVFTVQAHRSGPSEWFIGAVDGSSVSRCDSCEAEFSIMLLLL